MIIILNMTMVNFYRKMLKKKTAEKLVYLYQMNEILTRQVWPGHSCSCNFEKFFSDEERHYQRGVFDEYLALLSMSIMIDETLYYVLVDNRKNPECLKERDVYEEYSQYFKFIKLWYHLTAIHISPVFVLKKFRHPESETFIAIETETIRKAKQLLWDSGVKVYLIKKGRADIAELCEKEFLRDLTIRDRYSADDESKLKPIFE